MPDKAIPAVPRLARLAWLLFMQPIHLHRLLAAWDLKGDPSLMNLWPRIKAREPVITKLLGRWVLLLFVCAPAFTLACAGGLSLLGFPLHRSGAAVGMMAGMMVGLAACVVFDTTRGVAACVVGGVAGCIAGGVVFGTALYGVFSVAVGAVIGMVFRVASGVVFGVARRVTTNVMFGLMVGVTLGVITGIESGVVFGAMFGVKLFASTQVILFGLLSYPLETFVSLLLSWWVRMAPEQSPRMARWLPFRHHDLIYLPLLGLDAFLLQAAETHPDVAKELLTETVASTGQNKIARRILIELQARDLEKAAHEHTFDRVADLELPFLPPVSTLDSSSPINLFQAAAIDLSVHVGSHLQRRRALERARRILESLIAACTASRSSTTEFAHRFLSTARLWLDVIQEEERKLAEDEAHHPQVPRAFIAGPVLAPEDAWGGFLFQGRKDLARLVEHDLDPDRRGILVIVGQRRIGKSSFGNWLPRFLGTGTRVLIANFQVLSGHPQRTAPHRLLLDLVATCFPNAPPPPESSHWNEALSWLRARDVTLVDRNVLVVIDEVERIQDGINAGWCSPDFLDFLRAAGDALRRIRFLLLTAYPLYRLGHHWADRLISSTSRGISYLDAESAEELVRKPTPDFPDIYPEGGVERILRETHCHPFLIQKVCDELCKYLNEHGGRRRATDEELTEVFDRVTEEKLFDELWSQRTVEEQQALHRLACTKEPLDADPTMRQLAREGYVELHGQQATLAVPLFGAWIRFTQGTLVQTQAPSASLVPSVFIAGNPLLLDDLHGQTLFKGRADLARLLEQDLALGRRGVLLIIGQRHMGKSSFRNWLPRLLGNSTDVRVANFQNLRSYHRTSPHRWLMELIATCFPEAPHPPANPHLNEALDWLRARDVTLVDRNVLVVIDEVERIQDGINAGWCSPDFLDFLRAAGDSLRAIHLLLLTGYPLHRLGSHWIDLLSSAITHTISYLDAESAEELVRKPTPDFPDIYPEGGVERILRETHCHPFLIQKVCDELCKYLNEHGGRRRATDEELTEVFDRVTEEKLFDELWSQRTVEEQQALHRLACTKEPLDADPTMRQLAREGYVELHGQQATLAVPLFGAWIRFIQMRIADRGKIHA